MLRKDLRVDICPEINPPSGPNPTIVRRRRRRASSSSSRTSPTRPRAACWSSLIVLYVGSQLLSTLLMSTTTDTNQRMIILALPFFFVLFIWQFPAGLLVYWITTNLWTIVQQAIVRQRLGPLRPPGQRAGVAQRHDREAPRRRSRRRPATSGRRSATARREGDGRPRWPSPRRGRTGATARSAAQEEETIREAPMSERISGPDRGRPRELLEQVVDALGLDAEVQRRAGRGRIRGGRSTARTSGCSSAATAQTIDAVQHLAFKVAGREAAGAGVRVVVDAEGYRASAARRRWSARPTRPPTTRSAPAAPSRSTR